MLFPVSNNFGPQKNAVAHEVQTGGILPKGPNINDISIHDFDKIYSEENNHVEPLYGINLPDEGNGSRFDHEIMETLYDELDNGLEPLYGINLPDDFSID